ncbi:hypothetical protein BGZ73_005841 [Actinomortierella ambigua]|nr:hypothetical protein BGZ73_005841 [Actinomortierella ambigua]
MAALRRRSSNAVLLRRGLPSSSSSSSSVALFTSHEPWAGWSTVLKVLYAIIVPAIIIYMLARIEPRARTASNTSEYPQQVNKEQSQRPLSPWGMNMQLRGGSSKKGQFTSSTTPMAGIHQTSFDGFMLFGDSITQYSFNTDLRGFGAQLAHQFQRRLDVINRGFSGYTTEEAIHLLPQFLPQAQTSEAADKTRPKIQFLTIFFGANDACIPGSFQHVPLERYECNLRTLIDMVHSPSSPYYAPWTKIIIICPPVIDYDRWNQHRQKQGRPMDRTIERSQQAAAKCLEVAREYQRKNEAGLATRSHQVDVIDTWNLMNDQIVAGNKTLRDYLFDGLHLNSDGNELIYQELMKLIRTKYAEWDPNVMPMHAPWWGNINKEHPETDLLICANKRS